MKRLRACWHCDVSLDYDESSKRCPNCGEGNPCGPAPSDTPMSGEAAPLVKTITKTEYQALVGLKALSDRLQKQREELELTVREITGEGDGSYHSTDFVYGDESPKVMLKRLGITVAAEKRTK
jgi:hypothetical protein